MDGCRARNLEKGMPVSKDCQCVSAWPENPSVLASWQVNSSLQMTVPGLMTPVIKVIQRPASAPSPCSPSKLLMMLYLFVLLGGCILLLTQTFRTAWQLPFLVQIAKLALCFAHQSLVSSRGLINYKPTDTFRCLDLQS